MDVSANDEGEPCAQAPDMAASAEGERVVFIAGLHRSGTSILHRCLRDHPQASGFHDTGAHEDEGQHLQSVYTPAGALGGPGLFGFRPEAYLDESSPLASRATAERLLGDWLPHWDVSQPILLEKSPPNLVRTRFFQALFPSARFIILTRHPIAVGYATQKWTSRATWLRRLGFPDQRQPKVWIHTLVEHWLRCYERFERDRYFLKRVHVLSYEEFVHAPQEHLDVIFDFLGLARIPLGREIRSDVNDRYLARWTRLREGALTRCYARWVIRRYEDRVRRFGYSLADELVR